MIVQKDSVTLSKEEFGEYVFAKIALLTLFKKRRNLIRYYG